MLQNFLQDKGIEQMIAPPYTPSYQGKVERANRTIFEMAQAMRLAAKLPDAY